MKRRIDAYVVGAGGQARETAFLIEANKALRFRGYLVEEGFAPARGTRITLGQVLGSPALLADRDGVYYAGIGDGAVRERIVRDVGQDRLGPPLIAPGVRVHRSVEAGRGTLVCGGVTLTVDATIGTACLLNCNASVAHDVRMGAYSTCAPSSAISGAVVLGERVFIGTGAAVIEKVRIGDDVLVGAGAVVVDDLAQPGTYAGVPARRLNAGRKPGAARVRSRR